MFLLLTKQQLFCLVSRNLCLLSGSLVCSSIMSAAERSFDISVWTEKKNQNKLRRKELGSMAVLN